MPYDFENDPFDQSSYDTELIDTPIPSPGMTAVPIIAATPLPAPGLIDLPLVTMAQTSQIDPNDVWGTNTPPSTLSGQSFIQKALSAVSKIFGGPDAVHPTPSTPGPSGTKTISYTQKSASQNAQSSSMIGGLSIATVFLLAGIGYVIYLIFGKSK